MKVDFMLAKEYVKGAPPPKSDSECQPPVGWFLSEKYDGYRARYMHETGVLLSRQQKQFMFPEWFHLAMPIGHNLDGELWLGRDNFESTGLVRKKNPVPEEWAKVQYLVYDLPDLEHPFSERVKRLKKIISDNKVRWRIIRKSLGEPFSLLECPIVFAKQEKIKCESHLEKVYRQIIDEGGEGVMIKHPDSYYQNNRSNYMLKYKPAFDEEAIIVGYSPGQGKYSGKLGAFVCQQLINCDTHHIIDTNSDHNFTISGMDDTIRDNYQESHPVGTIISYEHSGKTLKGKPRFGRYVRKRDDIIIQEQSSEIDRSHIYKILKAMGDHEKNNGESFKSSSYFKAIRGIEGLSEITEESLLSVKGIGKNLSEKIMTIIHTGTCPFYEKIKDIKDGKSEFMNISGVGPKKAKDLVSMGYNSLESLRKCPNLSEILTRNQMTGVKYYEDILERIPRSEIDNHNDYLQSLLQEIDPDAELTIAGSYRRESSDSGDIDVLLKGTHKLYKSFISLLEEKGYLYETLAKGTKKYNGMCRLHGGNVFRRIDIMITKPSEYPFAILYFTGSKDMNTTMRQKALSLGYSLNEYSLQYVDSEKKGSPLDTMNVNNEKDIFDCLEMDYVEPKDR